MPAFLQANARDANGGRYGAREANEDEISSDRTRQRIPARGRSTLNSEYRRSVLRPREPPLKMELQLGKSSYERQYGRMPPIVLENRFFEENPTDQLTKSALLSRPGTDTLTGFGAGPIRSLFSLDGVFGGDLFVVSGVDGSLFRYSRDGTTKTTLTGTIFGSAFAPM